VQSLTDVAESNLSSGRAGRSPADLPRPDGWRSWRFRFFKRSFDIVVSVALLPALLTVALALLVLNPLFNRGPLFFVQERMGRGCRPFRAWKFRSMVPVSEIDRGAFDALDTHRITSLGRVLRRSRLDELPQVLNVLRGEMSLIGPRPDYLAHALVYLETVPGYRERHQVLPGISGYAQIELGYVDGVKGVQAKVDADLEYVRHASLFLDLWIAWRTLQVMLAREGA
jgi:lipopolysaccharide/colanic/teichoic acid biosynthesis glycosyltransferase